MLLIRQVIEKSVFSKTVTDVAVFIQSVMYPMFADNVLGKLESDYKNQRDKQV
jgi:hypothetical protein